MNKLNKFTLKLCMPNMYLILGSYHNTYFVAAGLAKSHEMKFCGER